MSRAAVLLVDDATLPREVSQAYLEEQGFEVVTADSGLSALDLLAKRRPDVVVCDLRMPGMDGYEVLRHVHDRDPTLPFVVLSSNDELGGVLRAIRDGAFDYVVKGPDQVERLVVAVRRAVEHGRVVRENARLAAELAARLEELDERNRRLEEQIRIRAEAEQAARDASRAKSMFLANMSHELRTPLNAILGYSDLLLEDVEQAAARGDLERIQSAGRHLLGLIDEVLDLSKLEAGRVALVIEQLEVRALLDAVVATAMPLVARNGNELEVDDRVPEGLLWADGQRLRQILLNLLSNAAKFTSRGHVRLRVDRVHDLGREWMTFQVSDTGIGMTPAQMGTVFEEFGQADVSISRRFGGTGLGLALSRKLARIMRGGLEIETSHPGRGSTFTLRLPFDQGGPASNATPSGLPGGCVLVADDDSAGCDAAMRLHTSEQPPLEASVISGVGSDGFESVPAVILSGLERGSSGRGFDTPSLRRSTTREELVARLRRTS